MRDRLNLMGSARLMFPENLGGMRLPRVSYHPDAPPAGDPPANTPPAGDPPADPPVTPPANNPPANVLNDPPANTSPAGDPPAVGDWPSDWREKMAGGNDKFLATLKRFQSPQSFATSYAALRQRMDSGELKRASPGANAKPEEIAEWRREMGIPESADKYDLKFDDGLVIGEEDKPYINKFLERIHGKNASNDLARESVKAYYEIMEEQKNARIDLDNQQKAETEEVLRAEWGPEYRGNLMGIHNLLDTAPEGVKDRLFSARLGDGRPVFSDPDIMRFFSQVSRDINPVPTIQPGQGGSQLAGIETRLTELKTLMGDYNSKYWKGPESAKLQEEFRMLAEADAKLRARSNAA